MSSDLRFEISNLESPISNFKFQIQNGLSSVIIPRFTLSHPTRSLPRFERREKKRQFRELFRAPARINCDTRESRAAGRVRDSSRRMTSPTIPSDAELLRLISAGDADAFTTLYRRRQGGVYRFALQMCGSEAIAEDVTQEVFLVLMRDAHHYDATRGSLAGYLYGIARNHVLRSFERERQWVALADDECETGTPVHERLIARDDPLDDLTRGEMVERLRHAVLALPPHYREVVVLCELHELSYAETASALDCAVGTVRSRLHRARSMLIERMRAAAWEGEGAAERSAETDAGEATTRAFKTARCFV